VGVDRYLPRTLRRDRVEPRGIEFIPEAERHGDPRQLSGVWTAAVLTPFYLFIGGLLISLGFNLWQAFLASAFAYAFFGLIGLQAIAGPRAGTSTIAISRMQYGIRGNMVSAALGWFNLIAFIAINASIATLALVSLAALAGWDAGDGERALLLALVVLATFVIAYVGHAAVLRAQRWLAYGIGSGALLAVAFVLDEVDWSHSSNAPLEGWAGVALWFFGANIVIAGALSWCSIPADYSRYLPRSTSSRAIAIYTALPGALAAFVLTSIGILAATAVDMTDPTTALKPLLPGWFYPIFLVLMVLGCIANNIVNVYSSSFALQALGVRLHRSLGVVLSAALSTAMTAYALFVADFLNTLTRFLQLMLFWYGPYAAIFLVDLALRREYGAESRGFNAAGLTALACGIAAATMFANNDTVQGPLSAALGDTDISALAGMAVGGAVYWLLARGAITAPAIPRGGGAR
jgi:nucleobase:cation symporter-1, NCS1 family